MHRLFETAGVLPEISPIEQDRVSSDGYVTLIFNNETNSMDEVMHILILATACTPEEAYIEMWEAHTYGMSKVHFSGEKECRTAAQIISSIGVKTEVRKEWD